MGSSNQVTQNGNTTLNWTLSGGGISNHDVIEPQLDNDGGGSGVQISDVIGFDNPTRYNFNIRVVGGAAIAFRVNNSSVG